MKAIEASGKTREEAMQGALKELGVELYEVDKIEVLDEGSKGLFGFGARPVRVRLTVEHLEDDRAAAPARGRGGRDQRPERGAERPQRPERGPQQQGPRGGDRGPRADNRGGQQAREGQQRGGQQRDNRNDRGGDRNRPERPQQGQQQQRAGEPQAQRPQGQQQRGPRPQQQPRTAPRPAAGGADDSARPRHVNVHEEALDALRRAEQFEQFDGVPAGKAAAPDAYDDPNALDVVDAAEAGGEERPDEAFEPITEEQGQEAAAVLRELIAKMGIEAEVTFVHTEDGTAKLDVRSQDSAMLIGRKGRTLGAIQYLVNRMVAQGDTAENTERLMVDVEGYVDRRRETLEDLARHFAGRVKESGRPARLKPLSPQERRIIHVTLRNDPEVRTASLGEALYRTVVISPINARPGRPQGQGGGGGRGRGSRGGRGRGGGGRRPDGPPRQRDAEIDPGQFGD
jgi:spoIIIJ-associated protein